MTGPRPQPGDARAYGQALRAVGQVVKEGAATIYHFFRRPDQALGDLGKYLGNAFIDGILAVTPEEMSKIQQDILRQGGDPSQVDMRVVSPQRQRQARFQIGAFASGAVAGGVTGAVTRTALASIPRHVLEGAVFGAVEGALTPIEEGESRGERIGVGAVAVGGISGVFGVVGQAARLAARSGLTRRGIKPEVETPEVTPEMRDIPEGTYEVITDAVFEPVVARPEPFRVPITDPNRLLLPARRTDPRGPTIGAQEAAVVEANNVVRAGMRRVLERPILNDVSAQEITVAMKEPIGKTKHTALELVKAEDNLGFDNPGQAVNAIIAHEDWATRWPAEGDISARRYKLLGEWRESTMPRVAQAMEEAQYELRTEGGGEAGLPLRGGMEIVRPEQAGQGGGTPPPPRGGVPETAPQPEPAGSGKPLPNYNDAVNSANSKISVGESQRGGRKTWDWFRTQFVEELWPLDKATRELLTLRQAAAQNLIEQGINVEVLGVGEPHGRAVARPGRALAGERIAQLPPGGGPLILRNTAGQALIPYSDAVRGGRSLAPGFRLPGLQDPYVLARLSRGSIDQGIEMLEHGVRDWTTLHRRGPGYREVAIEVAKRGLEDEVRAFLLAPRTLDFAARGMQGPITVEEATSIIKGAPQEVVDLAQKYFDFRNNLLEHYVRPSGMISEATYQAVRAASERFVSFERYWEPTEDPWLPGFLRPDKRVPQFKFQAAKGGKEALIVDPLESIISNTITMVTMANRHAALEALVRLAEGTPGQTIVRKVGEIARARDPKFVDDLAAELANAGIDVPTEVAEELALRLRPSLMGSGQFYVWRDKTVRYPIGEGEFREEVRPQKVVYEVDPELYDAILAMKAPQMHPLVNILSSFTSIFRAGVILDPAFGLIRNPFRDMTATAIYSRAGYKPVIDLAQGIFSAIRRDDLYHQFRADLGAHSSIVRSLSRDRDAAQRAYSHILTETSARGEFLALAKNPGYWLEALRYMTETFEAANRLRENARVYEQTGDPRVAGFAARDLLDFQKMGASVHLANSLSPFFAVTLQGVEKIPRAFKERPAGTAARIAAYLTLPTIALWLINFDDPEYQNLPWHIKDNYFLFPRWTFDTVPDPGGGLPHVKIRRDGFFKLPKPFELGTLFSTSVERILQWAAEHDDDFKRWANKENVVINDPFEQYLSGLLDQMVPGNLPPWLSIWLETQSGYDFFMDRQMVPESEKRLVDWLQAGPRQGETVRMLGKYLNMAPRLIDNMIADATGGLGRAAVSTVDRALQLAGAPGPGSRRPVQDAIPLIGPMISTILQNEPTINSKPVERFYKAYVDIGDIVNSIRVLEENQDFKAAQAMTAQSQPELMTFDHFVATARQMNEIKDQIHQIHRNPNINADVRQRNVTLWGRLYRSHAALAVRLYNQMKAAEGSEGKTMMQIPSLPKKVPR